MKLIDLHIHTTCSDGAMTPFEIIEESKNNGVGTISITDHDTIEAYTKELFEYAKKNNINLITGIEISTKISKCGIHVLGYNIDINDDEFNTVLSKVRNERHNYLHKVAIKLQELGYVINLEELDKIDSVTKAHIALDIINNKFNKNILINIFGHIPTKGEFIETIMNENCPAYVKKESLTPKEAADLIRNANGKVVLAHPVAYTYEDNLTIDDIQEIVDDMKPDGIEAYYIYLDRNCICHNDSKKWIEFAEKNRLFTTIGSDFHKKDNYHSLIGLINEDIIIDDKAKEKVLKILR